MTNKNTGRYWVLISVIGFIISSSTSLGTQMRTDLHVLAANGLKQLFQDERPGTSFAGEGGVVVHGQRIEVIPSIEQSLPQGGQWFTGVRFDIRLDGRDEPKYSFGAVGMGDSKEEAQHEAIQGWLAYFGKAFVAAMLQKDPGLEVAGFMVYPGALGMRGPSTDQVAEALRDMDRTIFSALAPMLSESTHETGPMTLNVMITRQGDGAVDGDCQLNGRGSTRGLAVLSHLSWPRNGSSYLLRKYYIFRRK
jgi:hypothetical protein